MNIVGFRLKCQLVDCIWNLGYSTLTPEINKKIKSMTEQMKESHKQIESSDKNKTMQKIDVQYVVIPHTCKGFRCPASRHQCKYCKKTGHFSHMCFKKTQEQMCKKGSHKLQAHQLQVRRYSSMNQHYNQDDTSESEDSFCLQMQIKQEQADHESCETQYLFIHLEYRLKCHRRSTKFLNRH